MKCHTLVIKDLSKNMVTYLHTACNCFATNSQQYYTRGLFESMFTQLWCPAGVQLDCVYLDILTEVYRNIKVRNIITLRFFNTYFLFWKCCEGRNKGKKQHFYSLNISVFQYNVTIFTHLEAHFSYENEQFVNNTNWCCLSLTGCYGSFVTHTIC